MSRQSYNILSCRAKVHRVQVQVPQGLRTQGGILACNQDLLLFIARCLLLALGRGRGRKSKRSSPLHAIYFGRNFIHEMQIVLGPPGVRPPRGAPEPLPRHPPQELPHHDLQNRLRRRRIRPGRRGVGAAISSRRWWQRRPPRHASRGTLPTLP